MVLALKVLAVLGFVVKAEMIVAMISLIRDSA